jgi:hypothetical protein
MKILAISREVPPVDWDALTDTLKEEAGALHQLYISDQIREFYFTDQGEAVLILECGSMNEARSVLECLPLVQRGMILFDVMELRPYTGFSRLFSEV